MKFTQVDASVVVSLTQVDVDRTVWANEDESCVISVHSRGYGGWHRDTVRVTVYLGAAACMGITCRQDGVESFIAKEIMDIAISCGGDYRTTDGCLGKFFAALGLSVIDLGRFRAYKEAMYEHEVC